MATQEQFEAAMYDVQIELAKLQVEEARARVASLQADTDLKRAQLEHVRRQNEGLQNATTG